MFGTVFDKNRIAQVNAQFADVLYVVADLLEVFGDFSAFEIFRLKYQALQTAN